MSTNKTAVMDEGNVLREETYPSQKIDAARVLLNDAIKQMIGSGAPFGIIEETRKAYQILTDLWYNGYPVRLRNWK
jgi:hypothetical protein